MVISFWFPYSELQRVLKDSGHKGAVRVHLNAVPARVRDHDSRDPLNDCVVVSGHVNAHQPMEVNDSVVFIDTFGCATIS